MNVLDRGIAVFSPRYAAKRMFARSVLAAYEGGRSTKRRRKSRDNSTGERQVARDAATVRATIRDLEPVSYTHLDVYKRQGHRRASQGVDARCPQRLRLGGSLPGT